MQRNVEECPAREPPDIHKGHRNQDGDEDDSDQSGNCVGHGVLPWISLSEDQVGYGRVGQGYQQHAQDLEAGCQEPDYREQKHVIPEHFEAFAARREEPVTRLRHVDYRILSDELQAFFETPQAAFQALHHGFDPCVLGIVFLVLVLHKLYDDPNGSDDCKHK